MMAWIALLALALQPQPVGIVEDECDFIELNTAHNVWFDDNGGVHVHVTFRQLIFWQLYDDGWYRVVAWRLANDAQLGPGMVTWRDSSNQMRRVRAPVVIVTFTDYDPELQNRGPWPVERRRELTRP